MAPVIGSLTSVSASVVPSTATPILTGTCLRAITAARLITSTVPSIGTGASGLTAMRAIEASGTPCVAGRAGAGIRHNRQHYGHGGAERGSETTEQNGAEGQNQNNGGRQSGSGAAIPLDGPHQCSHKVAYCDHNEDRSQKIRKRF